ncbi:MAG: NAD+ synthase [Firmicutes bacterium]|nr:NAD+ synthase [Bacillota bacterium]
MLDLNSIEEKIIKFIKDYIVESRSKGAVIGISGGIDSAVVAALTVKAIGGENILGLILPCESKNEDMNDAIELAKKLGIKYKIIDLTNTYLEFLKDNKMENQCNLSFCNIKPRLRMTTLYFHGSLNNYLVVGTSNKSELITGYLTKYGDGGVDIEPIADILKEEVYKIAEKLDIPKNIINKAPTADLMPNQTDEGEMGFTYEELDEFIRTGEGKEQTKSKIMKLYNQSRHKIIGPVMLKLDRKNYLE